MTFRISHGILVLSWDGRVHFIRPCPQSRKETIIKVLCSAIAAAIIILCLGFLYNASHAQGTPDQPQWFVSVVSTVCKETYVCNTCDGGNCQSTDFTVPTSGQYILYASVKCPFEIHCGHCRACASVYQGASRLFGVQSHCGDTSPCTGNNSLNPPTLTAGVTYTLCVCKIPCQDDGSHCGDCADVCEAIACITQALGGGGCGN